MGRSFTRRDRLASDGAARMRRAVVSLGKPAGQGAVYGLVCPRSTILATRCCRASTDRDATCPPPGGRWQRFQAPRADHIGAATCPPVRQPVGCPAADLVAAAIQLIPELGVHPSSSYDAGVGALRSGSSGGRVEPCPAA